MPVQAEFGIVGEIGAEPEEERPEVPIHAVDIEMVHHSCRADDPRIADAGPLVAPAFGAEHWRLLLSFADENHTFGLPELLPLLRCDVVLTLPSAELNDRNLLLPGILLQCRHEILADRVHQSTGGKLVPPMKTKEVHYSLFPLQTRNVNLQVHPVDPFHFQGDVIGQHFGHAAWYAHLGSGT